MLRCYQLYRVFPPFRGLPGEKPATDGQTTLNVEMFVSKCQNLAAALARPSAETNHGGCNWVELISVMSRGLKRLHRGS